MYVNGVKEYKIVLSEDTTDASYAKVTFNVVSNKTQEKMVLRETIDESTGDPLQGTLSTANLNIQPDVNFAHSEPLIVDLEEAQLETLSLGGTVTLLIELEAGPGIGEQVTVPPGGFNSPHIFFIINRIRTTVTLKQGSKNIGVDIHELPP